MSWTDVKAAKGVADAANAAVKTAVQRWENCVSQVASDLADPSKTSSDADPWHELSEASSEITNTTYEAFKDQLKLRMLQAGAEAEDVEKWIESNAKKIWEKAQAIRKSKAAQAAAAKAAKAVHWVKVAFASLVIGTLGVAFGVRKYENIKHGDAQTALNNTIAYYDNMQKFQANVNEYNSMMDSLQLDIPSVPDAVLPDTAPEAQAQLPEVTLPPAVAAIAQQPIQIQVMNPQGAVVQTATRTVEQVYKASPTSRPIIRERAECCTGGGGGGHRIEGWTVTGTPFGPVSFGF
jgi:hypothetical protein